MAESLRQTGPEQTTKTPERAGEVSKRKLEAMNPTQKKEVAQQIQSDPNWRIALDEVKSVAGAFWDGWEKGVNGAVKGGFHALKATGTWMGETAAEAVHGKEGGLTDKLVKDTQWIRDGLDTTGKVLGETTAKIVSTGEGGEVWKTTKDYWKGVGNTISNMSAEERAHAAGTGLAYVATAVVGAKGIDKLGKVSALSAEYSTGSGVVGSTLDSAISGGGQIGMELAVGSNQSKPKLGQTLAFKKQRGSIDMFARLDTVQLNKVFAGLKERIAKFGKEAIDTKAESLIKDTIEQGNATKLGLIIDTLAGSGNPKKMEFAKELTKMKQVLEEQKARSVQVSTEGESVSASIMRPEPTMAEETQLSESLKGLGHRGRINKLTEIFANGHPDRKTFAKAAEGRLEEAKNFIDDAKIHHSWSEDDAKSAMRKFLSELRDAAQSHIPEKSVPDFNTVEDAATYIKTL